MLGQRKPGILRVYHDVVALLELPGQDALGQGILQEALDGSPQGSSPVHRIEPFLRQPAARFGSQLEGNTPFLQTMAHFLHHQLYYLNDLLLGQRVEYYCLIDAIQELGPESPLQSVIYRASQVLLVHAPILGVGPEAEGLPLQVAGTQVAGHDYHGVAEVHSPAVAVG